MPGEMQDPNILRASGQMGQQGLVGGAQENTRDLLNLRRSLEKIGKAIEDGLDPGPWMRDLAMLRERNADMFKRETENYSKAAKHFVNNLGSLSLAMNDAARMSERAQAELKAKAADYTRAFRGMGVAGEEAAKMGKAALITGYGDSISAFVKRIREIKVLDLSPDQKKIAIGHAVVDRDKAMAGNQRMAELAEAGNEKSRKALTSAIGTSMKAAAKESSGVGGGGLKDLMSKGGGLSTAIAESIKGGKGFVGKTLGAMALNETVPNKDFGAQLGLGVMSKALGSMPQMFQQLIGYAGQFTSVAMSWGLIVKILTEVVGALDFYRKMQGVAVGYNRTAKQSYDDVASAISSKTTAVRSDLIYTGKGREIEAEAAEAAMKSGLAYMDQAGAIGQLTADWMRATIVGAEFGKSVSESIALAEKVTKAFGKTNVPENMRAMLLASKQANMSFEDMNSLLGDAVDLSMKFGRENAMSLQVGAMLTLKNNDNWAQGAAVLKAYNSLLNAPITYKAGLVMGANMGRPDQALGDLLRPGKGQSMLNVMGASVGAYMKIVDADLKRSVGPNMAVLAKGAAYGAFYQNAAIGETYAFLKPGKEREAFDRALQGGNKKDIDDFIRKAGKETGEQRGLTAMEKQVSLMEKLLVTITSGFQWVLDALPGAGRGGTGSGEDFKNQVNVNSGRLAGIG